MMACLALTDETKTYQCEDNDEGDERFTADFLPDETDPEDGESNLHRSVVPGPSIHQPHQHCGPPPGHMPPQLIASSPDQQPPMVNSSVMSNRHVYRGWHRPWPRAQQSGPYPHGMTNGYQNGGMIPLKSYPNSGGLPGGMAGAGMPHLRSPQSQLPQNMPASLSSGGMPPMHPRMDMQGQPMGMPPGIYMSPEYAGSRMHGMMSPHCMAERKKQLPHIKKPLNAFMLYMKEQRSKVVAECTLKESAAINQILGRKWHALDRTEQSKYYEMARRERAMHLQMYPGWSARDNYAIIAKKRKRKEKMGDGSGEETAPLKKCRARFGLDQQHKWCKPCRRKKKCIKFTSADDTGSDDEDGNNSKLNTSNVAEEKHASDKEESIASPQSSHGSEDDDGDFDHAAHHNEETRQPVSAPVPASATGAGIPVLANPVQRMASKEAFSPFSYGSHSHESSFRGAMAAAPGALTSPTRAENGIPSVSAANREVSALTSPRALSFSPPTCITPPLFNTLSPLMQSLSPHRCVTGGTPTSVLERPPLPQLTA